MDAKQVWRAALGELQVSLSPANFETWLKDTELVEIDDNRFRISAPNGFARDWLDNRYRPLISQTLARVVSAVEDPFPHVRAAQQRLHERLEAEGGQAGGGARRARLGAPRLARGLHRALRLALRYPALLGTLFELALEDDGQHIWLSASDYRENPALAVFNAEFCMVSLKVMPGLPVVMMIVSGVKGTPPGVRERR